MHHLQANARLWRITEWLAVAMALGWLFLWAWAVTLFPRRVAGRSFSSVTR
jgi:hypothetical protein